MLEVFHDFTFTTQTRSNRKRILYEEYALEGLCNNINMSDKIPCTVNINYNQILNLELKYYQDSNPLGLRF